MVQEMPIRSQLLVLFFISKKGLQELYDNATSWTWTRNAKTGETVKRQANCYSRWMDFRNGQTHSGWDLQTTEDNQYPNWEGWTMVSRPSRERGKLKILINGYEFSTPLCGYNSPPPFLL